MWKSMWIKLPTVGLALVTILVFDRPLSWWLASGVLLLGTVVLLAVVCSVKSCFFVPTVWRAPQPADAVALTFDDGPDARFTQRVLAILADRQVPATFFVVGQRVRANPELLASIHAQGHLIGNHTDTHSIWFHCRLWRRLRQEIQACNDAIESVIGRAPTLFRSPHGFKNPPLGDVVRELSMTTVGWQVRGGDAACGDPGRIRARIVDGVERGGVILLHDGAGLGGRHDLTATLDALPAIIDDLRAKGLRIVRLDELLGVAPYRQLAAS